MPKLRRTSSPKIEEMIRSEYNRLDDEVRQGKISKRKAAGAKALYARRARSGLMSHSHASIDDPDPLQPGAMPSVENDHRRDPSQPEVITPTDIGPAISGGTGPSRMDMGSVSGSSQTTTSNIILGSSISSDQQSRKGALHCGSQIGHQALESYDQWRQGVTTTAKEARDTVWRTANQTGQQNQRDLSSTHMISTENRLVDIAVAAAVGVLVGYLIGRTTFTRSTSTRWRESGDGPR